MKHVVIVGGGFAGLNAAKKLGGAPDVRVTLVDRQNYHLFQPLLYQVAMAGLSPADIAAPIRSLLARYENVSVLQGRIQSVDLQAQTASADFGQLEFDYLLLCCGASPALESSHRSARNRQAARREPWKNSVCKSGRIVL